MADTRFFASLETAFEDAFKTVVTDVKEFAIEVEAEVKTDIAALWAALAPAVLEAIKTEAPKLISGREKFGNAVDNVVMTAETKLIPIIQQDAQALVQNGWNWLQDKLKGT